MYYDTLLSWLMSIAGARELMEQVLLKPDITPKFCITLQVPSTNVAVAVILDTVDSNLFIRYDDMYSVAFRINY